MLSACETKHSVYSGPVAACVDAIPERLKKPYLPLPVPIKGRLNAFADEIVAKGPLTPDAALFVAALRKCAK